MSNTNSINWHCSTRNLSMQRAPPKKNDCKQCGTRNSCTKHNKRSKPTSGNKTSTSFVYYWNHLTRVSPFFLPFLLRFSILSSNLSAILSFFHAFFHAFFQEPRTHDLGRPPQFGEFHVPRHATYVACQPTRTRPVAGRCADCQRPENDG